MGIATAGKHSGALIGTLALGAIVESFGGNWLAAVPAMTVFVLLGIFGAVSFRHLMRKRHQSLQLI